jgi:hypothetical protein
VQRQQVLELAPLQLLLLQCLRPWLLLQEQLRWLLLYRLFCY